jgi:hypothetical protein
MWLYCRLGWGRGGRFNENKQSLSMMDHSCLTPFRPRRRIEESIRISEYTYGITKAESWLIVILHQLTAAGDYLWTVWESVWFWWLTRCLLMCVSFFMKVITSLGRFISIVILPLVLFCNTSCLLSRQKSFPIVRESIAPSSGWEDTATDISGAWSPIWCLSFALMSIFLCLSQT